MRKITLPYKKAKPQHITSLFRSTNRPDHNGLDLAYKYGTPLVAPDNAIVERIVAGDDIEDFAEDEEDIARGFGIVLRLDNGLRSLYWHCMPVFPVEEGDMVVKGKIVAYMGNSGFVMRDGKYIPIQYRGYSDGRKGTHVHWEIYEGNKETFYNPLELIDWNEKIIYPFKDFINSWWAIFYRIKDLWKSRKK